MKARALAMALGLAAASTGCGATPTNTAGSKKNVDDLVTVDGKPIAVLVEGQEFPIHLAADATHLYWTNHLGGSVARVAKTGGAVEVLATGQDYPNGIAVDDASVYFTTLNGGQVVKVAKTGGDVTELVGRQFGPAGVTVDGTHVYWTNLYAGSVMRVARTGGAPESLASDQIGPVAIAVAGGQVYWCNQGKEPELTGGGVMVRPVEGGDVKQLIAGTIGARAIRGDATAMYVIESGAPGGSTGRLHKIDGADATTSVIAANLGSPTELALDDATIYLSAEDRGQVGSIAKTGGALNPIAVGRAGPYGIAVDGAALYWVNYRSGRVVRVAK